MVGWLVVVNKARLLMLVRLLGMPLPRLSGSLSSKAIKRKNLPPISHIRVASSPLVKCLFGQKGTKTYVRAAQLLFCYSCMLYSVKIRAL